MKDRRRTNSTKIYKGRKLESNDSQIPVATRHIVDENNIPLSLNLSPQNCATLVMTPKGMLSFKDNQINEQECKDNNLCNRRPGRNRLFFAQHMPSLHNDFENNEMCMVLVNHRL